MKIESMKALELEKQRVDLMLQLLDVQQELEETEEQIKKLEEETRKQKAKEWLRTLSKKQLLRLWRTYSPNEERGENHCENRAE